jgi:hypothetical protein
VSHRTGSSRSYARLGLAPRVEPLEERRLTAVTFHSFGVFSGFPDGQSTLYGLTNGPDGALYFAYAGGVPLRSEIDRITTTGVVTNFSVYPARPRGITSGT